MRQLFWIVVTVACAAWAGFEYAARGQAPARQASGVLSVLSRGQQVAVKESGGRFEINSFAGSGNFLGFEVVDVDPQYVVLRDLTGVTETRVPIYSIKAVITGRSDAR